MATIAGLVALVSALGDYFEANGVAAKVDFGLKARASQMNQGPGGASRVVLIPGEIDPSSPAPPKVVSAGDFTGPRHTHGNPNELATWEQVVSVSIWAVDASTPAAAQSELAQYAAVVELLEATYQGLHNAVYTDADDNEIPVGLADLVLRDAKWVSPPTEQAFGRELVAFFTYSGPLFDRVIDTTTPKPAVNRGAITT